MILAAPSSRGLGQRILIPLTPVRIRVGSQNMKDSWEKDVKLTVTELLSSEAILMSVDKLKLGLNKVTELLEIKNSYKYTLGLVLSTLTVLVTSEFKDIVLNKESWKNIFILVFIVSLLHFVISLFRFIFIKFKKLDSADMLISFFDYPKSFKTKVKVKKHKKVKSDSLNVTAPYFDYVIFIPSGTTQSQLIELNSVLKLNRNGKKVLVKLPNGKEVVLSYGVNVTDELKKRIDTILNNKLPF